MDYLADDFNPARRVLIYAPLCLEREKYMHGASHLRVQLITTGRLLVHFKARAFGHIFPSETCFPITSRLQQVRTIIGHDSS